MIDNSDQEHALPEEFKKKPIRLSFFRIFGMTFVMGLAVLFVKPHVHEVNHSSAPSGGDVADISDAKADQTRVGSSNPDLESADHQPRNRHEDSQRIQYPASFEFLNATGPLRKYVYNEKAKRVFVAADVINFRIKPGGGLLGQLSKGDVLEILGEPDQTGFLKVMTSYGQIGYVSKDLVSSERAFSVFDFDGHFGFQANDVVVSVSPSQNSDELSRHYNLFLGLLDKLPTKASFDFSNSSLRYMFLSSSEVIYPSDPSILLHIIRQSSFKPAIFLERAKTTNQSTVGSMIVKTKLPVRRVPANQGGQSTSLQQLDVVTKCYPFSVSVKDDQSISSKIELMIIDIKKSTTATLTTRPHKGDPNFIWAFADLNGDTWQDVAIYFGGQTSASPYKFLFIGHNIGGNWQVHRIEDRSGYNQNCA
jgi:uncharacterized protein YgiM (DUF1202 family)